MLRLFAGLTATQAVLTLRTLYRLIQYALGTGHNVVSSREWCFYVFDASLTLICAMLFAAFDQQRTIENAQQDLANRRTRKATPA